MMAIRCLRSTFPFLLACSAAGVASAIAAVRPPVVLNDPISWIYLPGEELAGLTVSVGGEGPFTYQWKKEGQPIPGATAWNFAPDHKATSADAGLYTVEVSNDAGSVTSRAAYIKVLPPIPPTIDGVSDFVRLEEGRQAVLSVSVSGAPAPSLQWKRNGVAIAGATDRNYTIDPVTLADAGLYTVTMTNAGGTVDATVQLQVDPAVVPVIGRHPLSGSALPGSRFILQASVATFRSAAAYQWFHDGQPIPGATSSEYVIPAMQASNAGRYKVVVTNPAGSVTSQEGVVTLDLPGSQPPITSTSGDILLYGGPFSLPLSLAQASDTVQWLKNDQEIPGARSPIYEVQTPTFADAGVYKARVTTASGTVFSRPITVGLDGLGEVPRILQQPRAGKSSASVWAAGESPLTFQWFRNGVLLPSSTSPSLNVTAAGNYTVVVSNRLGSVTSNAVALAPKPAAVPQLPRIHYQPGSQAVVYGSYYNRLETWAGAEAAATYQWYKDGVALPGGRNYQFSLIGRAGVAGRYWAVITNAAGSVTTDEAIVTLASESEELPGPGQLVNLSTRGLSRGGEGVLTAGFVVDGAGGRNILVRAVGPGLQDMKVSNWLPNPRLRLLNVGGAPLVENDNWGERGGAGIVAAAGRTGAFPLLPGSFDAAVATRVEHGLYTAQAEAGGANSGIALVEVYDDSLAESSPARLVNISTRGEVGRGDEILIVGFVVAGSGPQRVLIRAVGPGLKKQGVNAVLEDPQLELAGLARPKYYILPPEINDDWSSSADAGTIAQVARRVGAFDLDPGSKDAALLVHLPPGPYTTLVRGTGETTGIALVEVYYVPND